MQTIYIKKESIVQDYPNSGTIEELDSVISQAHLKAVLATAMPKLSKELANREIH
jgi:hypothetical protein